MQIDEAFSRSCQLRREIPEGQSLCARREREGERSARRCFHGNHLIRVVHDSAVIEREQHGVDDDDNPGLTNAQ